MAFEKNNWKSGDVITSEKLNAMEDGIVEGSEPVAWEDVTGKPTTFTPTIGTTATTAKAGNYTPTYAEITGKPTTFAPSTHSHAWEDITNKPATFAPATHSHSWADVTNKPATFAPTIGTTATTAKAGNYVPTYAEITGKPTTFTPETHSHAWADITGKPTTFTPTTHTHTVANITGLQAVLDDFEARLSALEAKAEAPTDPEEGA